jgi:probable HAF family extracellular repeat protein
MSNSINLTKKLFAVTILLMVGLCSVADCAVMYNVTEIEGLSVSSFVVSMGINNAGQVVGTNFIDYQAVMWDNGVITPLDTLGGSMTEAYDINDDGQIVGMAETPDENLRAVLWDNGTPIDLGTLDNQPRSFAIAINSAGLICGFAGTSTTRSAFVYDGAMTSIGTLGGDRSEAFGINDSGEIVGMATTATSGFTHSFLWDGAMTDLGSMTNHGDRWANDINDFGLVVGSAYPPVFPGVSQAIIWEGSGYLDIGVGEAHAVNSAGQVVGTSGSKDYMYNSGYIAFIWEDGVRTELNSLIAPGSGWNLKVAYDINDVGQIVGSGTNPLGQSSTFLLTPIPEPCTTATGLIFLSFLCRRHRFTR